MNSAKMTAKISAYGYLVIFILGMFANFFVLETLIVPGDAAATANNIASNESLFRIGILSFIIMVVSDLLVTWALYIFLKPVNKNISLLAGWLRLVNCAIFGLAVFNLIGVLHLIGPAEYLTSIETKFLDVQIMLLLDAFNKTWLIGLIFFGIHLFILGYLIIKSKYIPNILGILLIAASAGYLVDSFANFLLSNYDNYKDIFLLIVVVPGIIGELSFCLWLLFRGTKLPEIITET